MKQFFSEFFEVSETVLEDYGTFNISLLADLPLFIDPFLLFNSKKPEYIELHKQIIRYLVFLRDKAVENKLNDGLIAAWYRFPEVKQNWLGYSKTTNKGSGLGIKFANALTLNLREFAKFGHKRISGNHFEKICLVNSGVGKDNISDFTTNLIKDYLLNYTQEFAQKYLNKKFRAIHRVNKVKFNYDTETWMPESFELPTFEGDFVILTPLDMLTKDETWINRPDFIRSFKLVIDSVPDASLRAQFANYLENKLIELVGEEKPTAKQQAEAINETILHFPELIEYYVKEKEENGSLAESISTSKVIESKQLYIKHFKQLGIQLVNTTNFYNIDNHSYKDSFERLQILKHTIEKDKGNEVFYFENKPIEDEDNLSILFRLTWKASKSGVINENGSEIITTWKDSKKRLKIVLKLSKNTQIKKTLEKLRNVYDESLSEQEYILVIIHYSEEELTNIKYLLKSMNMSEHKNIVFINAGKSEESVNLNDPEISAEKSMTTTNANFENGYALLIGVGKDLPVTIDDATALHHILINPNRAAYPSNQVKLLTEKSANKKSILDAFDRLIESSNKNPDATVIIYYSGHGGVLDNPNNPSEYFLVPNDYNPTDWSNTVIFGHEFINKVKAFKAKKLLILLDCCHAGGIPTPKTVGNGFAKFIKAPAPPDLASVLSTGSGQIMIASSREDEYSYTDNPYSIFTICLIEALSGKAAGSKDGYARILDVIGYLLEQVPLRASGEQHPFVSQINALSENFPICFYDGGGKNVSESLRVEDKVPLTDAQRTRLNARYEGLQSTWNIQNTKVNKIRESVAFETSPTIKYQREQELITALAELDKIESEIEEIEKKTNL